MNFSFEKDVDAEPCTKKKKSVNSFNFSNW